MTPSWWWRISTATSRTAWPHSRRRCRVREIAFTVLSISLSLVAVFIPLLLMGGIMGRVFREFAVTVTAAIAVSAFVSLTLAPMLCSRFMKPQPDHQGRFYLALETGFDAILAGYRRTL